ncbi:hypothetical protein KY329_01095 [Candidatus Woesearchaeota archaeon]|nr:hypothetical protein [Candidatus Woesearchaeota archaeon]
MSGARKRDAKTGYWSAENLARQASQLPDDITSEYATVDYKILSVGSFNPNWTNYAFVSTANTELQNGEYLNPVFTDVKADALFDILLYAALNAPQDVILVGAVPQGTVTVIASALSTHAKKPPILQINPNVEDALEHIVKDQLMIVTPPKYFMSVFGSLLDEYVAAYDATPEPRELPPSILTPRYITPSRPAPSRIIIQETKRIIRDS